MAFERTLREVEDTARALAAAVRRANADWADPAWQRLEQGGLLPLQVRERALLESVRQTDAAVQRALREL